MANKKSPASQAIKDMLEMGIDVTFFTGNIMKIHVMNSRVNIITKEHVKKEKRVKPAKVYAPKATPTPKHVYNQRIVINIDGTVSIDVTEWDYK